MLLYRPDVFPTADRKLLLNQPKNRCATSPFARGVGKNIILYWSWGGGLQVAPLRIFFSKKGVF